MITVMQRGSEKRRGQRGSTPVCECRPDTLTCWVHACCNVLHPWTATGVFAKLCANHERTLSPLQAPNSLDAQAPSPSEELSLEDLAGLEEVELDRDLIDALDDPTDMFICGFPMNTSLGQGTTMDHTIPITSNYMYIPGVVPVRPLEGQSPVCYAHRERLPNLRLFDAPTTIASFATSACLSGRRNASYTYTSAVHELLQLFALEVFIFFPDPSPDLPGDCSSSSSSSSSSLF